LLTFDDTDRMADTALASADPVLILAPPCTFSWVVCAMLGQHPQMYGLPELHLFLTSTMGEWWDLCSRSNFEMDHGLARAVAELYFGEQTDTSVSRARGWLRRRGHYTTGLLMEELIDRLKPLVAVEKSPSVAVELTALERAFDMFPNARFLHLVSHPRRYCDLVVDAIREAQKARPLPQSHWLVRLASEDPPLGADGVSIAELDPQISWLHSNCAIRDYLSRVPEGQRMQARGEEIFAGSTDALAEIARWLHLRTDAEALDRMRHPERSPYAHKGPPSAAFGSDLFLRIGPLVRPEWTDGRSLEGPLGWRTDRHGMRPEVVELAASFGYT